MEPTGPLITPIKALNKAYRRQPVDRPDIERFKENLSSLLKGLNPDESEEHLKNNVTTFLNDTWYKGEFAINTKGRTDLVIHNDKTTKSTAGVLLEIKKPGNREMVSKENLNTKALQELVLYYLRERIEEENKDIKHLIITNAYEWFIFDGEVFYQCFYKNPKLLKAFKEWNAGQKDSAQTTMFYKDIAGPAIEEQKDKLSFTWFDFRDLTNDLNKGNDSQKLIAHYKVLSPVHLLNQPFANDSNSLNKQFYHELLHIIGLEEVKDKGKKVIRRKEKDKRNDGSLLENAINIMEERDRHRVLNNPRHFGETVEEQLYSVALELCITWINRILFLKLLESQLVTYHKGDKQYRFLDISTVPNFDSLEGLFFSVLAKKHGERNEPYREKFAHVPYLNSSLFEPTGLEEVLTITMLNNNLGLKLYGQTVLKNEKGARLSGSKDTLTYLFEFLDAYNFSSEGKEEVQEVRKSLINASVLGLIFEKINGYKDGSFYTPGFITMYMCRETIRRAVVQKFNESWGWKCKEFDDLKEDLVEEIRTSEKGRNTIRKEANGIINSLKICDPAVGSGHFLVSALNEIIAIKSELHVLTDRKGEVLSGYQIEIENDELAITDLEAQLFKYSPADKESQRVQEALFHEKQTIIENCLFGVDINPNSVKICWLRLWIELLKSAYYRQKEGSTSASPVCAADGEELQPGYQLEVEELETLPNIDINIKRGNSLISRFDLDTDISEALKKSKWDVATYRNVVNGYKNATRKEDKREFERLIEDIKSDFETEISKKDKRVVRASKLKGELFNLTEAPKLFEQTTTEKKKWEKDTQAKIKALQKLEQELAEIKNNKIYEDAFEWRFEFPEVLDDAGNFVGFDVVIGNPPYIRQEELAAIKPYLSEHYTTFTGTADLYVYFVELGMNLLSEDGSFTFIIPNKWMRAGYGQKLRQFVKGYHIHELLDFGDLPVFEEATTYPLIIELSKSEATAEFEAVNFTTLDFEPSMKAYVNAQKFTVLSEELSDLGWTLIDSKVQKLLAKIRSKGTPLGEYVNGNIFYGIKTGFNEAFVIDRETRDRLITEDSKSAKIIKPFLAGRDIKRYQQPESDKYLIFTRRGIEIENYPAIYKHLEQFRNQLEPRPKDHKGEWPGRKPGSYKWYEIQDAVDYYEEFEKVKILWPGISSQVTSFAFDSEKLYGNDNNQMIIISDLLVLAVLNSSVSNLYLRNVCDFVRGGFARLKISYVQQIPIPKSTSDQHKEITDRTKQVLIKKGLGNNIDTQSMEKEIDQLVYKLYGLTDEEVKIVEGNIK